MIAAVHVQRERAESFGSVAEDYDRFRPSYPAALFDDLVTDTPRSALDVGCGTGKAARELAARGLRVLGLEVDARMAAVARRHGIDVEVSAFETWDARGCRFDLITVAQAWHWIDPDAGAVRARELLRRGGRLALFWNHNDAGADFDEVYRAVAPQLVTDEDRRPAKYADRLAAAGGFTVTTREYPWSRTYTAEQWIGYVSTFSDHVALPSEQLAAVRDGLRREIAARGGTVRLRGGTYVILARTDTA